MPISYQIHKARKRVLTTVTGPISVEDILGQFQAAIREGVLAYEELIDAFLSTHDIWRAADLVRLVLDTPSERHFGPRAVIVRDDAVFGMTRMFANLLSGFFPIRVFREPGAAEEWLAGWNEAADGT